MHFTQNDANVTVNTSSKEQEHLGGTPIIRCAPLGYTI